ncbi:MAG: hypothetical protein MSA72_17815 [Lachnospiraceae bacterium]|nr:hypothetical protein [Lachnospiraceae bacterium]
MPVCDKYSGDNVFGANQELLLTMTVTGGLSEMIGVLLVDVILALTDGILLVFALRYFKAEQADGTPFTQHGADRILHLGILTIVLLLVAAILSTLVCEFMTLPQDAVRDRGNLNSLTMGIVLILASLIFRYGAELETQKQEEGSRCE